MGKVIILPEVAHKLNQIVSVHYHKEYFGFIDSAFKYVDAIYDFIYKIPELHHRKTTNPKYGVFIAVTRSTIKQRGL